MKDNGQRSLTLQVTLQKTIYNYFSLHVIWTEVLRPRQAMRTTGTPLLGAEQTPRGVAEGAFLGRPTTRGKKGTGTTGEQWVPVTAEHRTWGVHGPTPKAIGREPKLRGVTVLSKGGEVGGGNEEQLWNDRGRSRLQLNLPTRHQDRTMWPAPPTLAKSP